MQSPSEPPRPLMAYRIDELRLFFNKNKASTEKLEVLLRELQHRDRRKAKELLAEVESALDRLRATAHESTSPSQCTSSSGRPTAPPHSSSTPTHVTRPQNRAVEFAELKKAGIDETTAFRAVSAKADELRRHLEEPQIQQRIRERHVHNANSTGIQEVILEGLTRLGFQNEKTGLFSEYEVRALRPDYFCAVNNTTGILVEVERGKTLPNNMDILDLWKCHICPHANYLFLIVPKVRHKRDGQETPQFSKVLRRLAPFFEPANYVNVDAVFLFGY